MDSGRVDGTTISGFQKYVWRVMEEKGFHDGRGAGRDDTLVRLCLIHTEVSEAAQEVKRHWSDSPSADLRDRLADELADIVIRVADLAECVGVDLEAHCVGKMLKNSLRPKNYGTPAEGGGR